MEFEFEFEFEFESEFESGIVKFHFPEFATSLTD